jgi:hypothetical protein
MSAAPDGVRSVTSALPTGQLGRLSLLWRFALGPLAIGSGGVAMIVGSLLPWANVHSFSGPVHVAGTAGGAGKLMVGLGGVLVLLALLTYMAGGPEPKLLVVDTALFALLGLGLGWFETYHLGNLVGYEVQWGLYICVVGGFIAIVGVLCIVLGHVPRVRRAR